jgi:hypothetical protein
LIAALFNYNRGGYLICWWEINNNHNWSEGKWESDLRVNITPFLNSREKVFLRDGKEKEHEKEKKKGRGRKQSKYGVREIECEVELMRSLKKERLDARPFTNPPCSLGVE